MDRMKRMVSRLGDHQLVHASSDEEALADIADAEVLMGHFPATLTHAGKHLRWIQSFSAGMDKLLDLVSWSVTKSPSPTWQGCMRRKAVNTLGSTPFPGTRNSSCRSEPFAPGVEGRRRGRVDRGRARHHRSRRLRNGNRETSRRVRHGGAGSGSGSNRGPGRSCRGRSPTKENLHSMLARSDAGGSRLPENEGNLSYDRPEELACMKGTAYLVCTSRGGIIDETALLEALESGAIAGAGLDVTEVEPLSADDRLWNAPNLVITPHRAGASQHRPRKVYEFFCEQLERYLNGEPVLNVVDKRLGF